VSLSREAYTTRPICFILIGSFLLLRSMLCYFEQSVTAVATVHVTEYNKPFHNVWLPYVVVGVMNSL